MKIVFICGSLEEGHDGVGDYTRRLAGEVVRMGHLARIVALNDKYIAKRFAGNQGADGTELPVLRVPSIWSTEVRFSQAKKWIEEFMPDWISLQFVPFSFDKRGLPFGLDRKLRSLEFKGHWHFMFHELWVGRERDSDWKLFFVSKLQKLLIKKMVNLLSPLVIHTHLPVFYSKLERFGWVIKKLPLFSNVGVAKGKGNNNGRILRVGFFSQIEANESIMTFLNILGEEASKRNLELEVLLIGGNEASIKSIGNALEKLKNLKKLVRYTGFLGIEELSNAIQKCTLGITPIPRHALGKSGSVSAFMTHGIPVAAPNFHFLYNPAEIGFFSADLRDAIVIEPDLCRLETAKNAACSARDKIQLSRIAETFLSDLNNSIVN